MQEIRQSTEIKVRIGGAMDATDGVTPETGLSLATADQTELLKHNGAATADVSANTFAAVTGCDGWYDMTLTSGNTDTLGQATIVIQDSSLMHPISRDFMVVTQNYWDSKYSTDKLQVDVRELGDANLALTTQMKADVNTECDTALTDYDSPTKAETDASFNLVITDTEDIQTQIGTAGVGLHDLGGMSVAMMGEVQTEANDALVAQNLDHLVKDPVDTSFANTVHLDSIIGNMSGVGGSATFSRSTDSAEAIRNRGDTAWTTGGAGSISEILNVQALIPNSIDLADTATVRLALGLTNMVDDLPSTAEITPGTITIDRKAIGATSWTTVEDASANSEVAGLVYYDEVFDTASGYAAGDSIRITFKSQKITVDANDFEITGTDGWTFQTHIREAMVGTANAALAATALTDATWTDAKAAFLDHSIATVDGNVDTLVTRVPDTVSLANINAEVDTAMGDYDAPKKSEMDTSFNSVITEVNANETKIDTMDAIVDRILAVTEVKAGLSVDDISATTTKFVSTLTATDNDYWNRMAVLFTSGNNAGLMRRIKDYVGATKEITLRSSLNAAPADGDTFVIPAVRAFLTPDVEDIADAVLDELTADHVLVGSLSKAVSDIDTTADSILLDTGTDGVVVASGSKTGYELSATGVTAVHDEIIEGTLTSRQMKRIDHAALAGESTGGGTATLAFRDDADAKARITATVDSNGNRTNIVKDGT